MRIAVDEDDRGHANYVRLSGEFPNHKPVVRLDGVVIAGVVIADEELGVLVREVTDYPPGLYMMVPVTKREELRGVVRIVWEPPSEQVAGVVPFGDPLRVSNYALAREVAKRSLRTV